MGSDAFAMINICLNWKPNLKFGSPSSTELRTECAVQFRVVQVWTEVQDQTFPALLMSLFILHLLHQFLTISYIELIYNIISYPHHDEACNDPNYTIFWFT